MRVIKFRGFHADEHGKTVIKLDGKEIQGFWCYGDLHTDGPYINEHKVIPETVGQYINKKDINDNEIFEGDILKEYYGNFVHPIYYDLWRAKFILKTTPPARFDFIMSDRFEKVGNIFESPELVEVAE